MSTDRHDHTEIRPDSPDTFLDTALSLDLDQAVQTAHAAAVNATHTEAQRLLGPAPENADDWNVAVQLLAFRIEHAAGFDATASVMDLRRWGVTWETIGRAAGISRQAAHARWGAAVRAILDRYGLGEPGGPVASDEDDLA